MLIKRLEIKNYKSIENLELKSLNNFSVFVGPNASGKSNIFEAIEFYISLSKSNNDDEVLRVFGRQEDIFNKNSNENYISVLFDLNYIEFFPSVLIKINNATNSVRIFRDKHSSYYFDEGNKKKLIDSENSDLNQIFNFSRNFIGNSKIKRHNYLDDSKLNADASNLELVLKRILKNETIREELLEELQLLIPGFSNIEIRSDEISGTDTLLIYEKGTTKPFGKNLLSDGTYNIIALLVAVYQSQEPQFLCIEEPENGLNPFVAKEFVRIFRNACSNKGHFIWINTHSQSILTELKKEEVIIVDKINGSTIAKQINNIDLHGLKLDEALFTNVLGGGTPW